MLGILGAGNADGGEGQVGTRREGSICEVLVGNAGEDGGEIVDILNGRQQ